MWGEKPTEEVGRGRDNEGSYLKKGGTQPPRLQPTDARSGGSRWSKMSASCSFCLLLLSFGACFPPDDGLQTSRRFAEKGLAGTEEQPGFRGADSPKWKRSAEDLRSLFSIAKELQSFGKEKAGIQFRFGRDREGENEAIHFLPGKEGAKWGDTLGSLAEELNGYNRKKGGFSFRFGRRAAQF